MRGVVLRLAIFCLLLVGWAAAAQTSRAWAAGSGCTPVTNNMVISSSVTLCRQTYHIADSDSNGVIIIQPAAGGLVVDGTGVSLVGGTLKGYGIWVSDPNGYALTIRGFSISGYYYGMRVESSSHVTIQSNTVSANAITHPYAFDINAPLGSAYGGGILLNRVANSSILANTLQKENTGIDLYASTGNLIQNNDTSNNSGWGIRLYGSSSNMINHNRSTNVQGAWDTAALLLTDGSNFNRVTRNNLTYSGDGFFLGNQFSATSNDNLIQRNDGSYSPHNCFEATFGSGNRFINNIATKCDYGFWLGYARNALVQDNIVQGNTHDGVAIEHGCQGTFTHNLLESDGEYGFWANGAPSSDPHWPCAIATNSHVLGQNTIDGNTAAGIYLNDTSSTQVGGASAQSANAVVANPQGIYVGGVSPASSAHNNNLTCDTPCLYSVYNGMSGVSFSASNNYWGTTVQTFGPVDASSPLATAPTVTKPATPNGIP